MPQFRRKKASKSFPVKVCTLDAELEFNLEVRILTNVVILRIGKITLLLFIVEIGV